MHLDLTAISRIEQDVSMLAHALRHIPFDEASVQIRKWVLSILPPGRILPIGRKDQPAHAGLHVILGLERADIETRDGNVHPRLALHLLDMAGRERFISLALDLPGMRPIPGQGHKRYSVVMLACDMI